jgi:hypothetical protein
VAACATQDNIRGTAWAGYQSITEWLDHKQPAKSDYHRANKVLADGTVTATKARLRPGPGRLTHTAAPDDVEVLPSPLPAAGA